MKKEINKAENDYIQAGVSIPTGQESTCPSQKNSIETIQKHWELDENSINQRTETGERNYSKQSNRRV